MSYDLSFIKRIFSSKYTLSLVILMASVGVYLNTLPNDFIFDDKVQLLRNPWIKDVKYIPDIFLSDVWGFAGFKGASNHYRPMMYLLYMADYHIFGFKPWGFHLTNIIFHAGVSVLVFFVATILLTQQIAITSGFPASERLESEQVLPNSSTLMFAFIAALLFATHPIHTEVVAWIGAIPELLFTFFYLISLYWYIKADKPLSIAHLLSVAFFSISTLCKETTLTLPLILLAYDYSFRKNLFRISLQNLAPLIKRYMPYLLVAVAYLIFRNYAIGGFAPAKEHANLSDYQYFINIFPLFAQYLEKLFFPINLNAFYTFNPISSILELEGILALIITFSFITLVYMFRRNRLIFFCLLWITIPLLPVLYIPALTSNPFTERYLYLPSVGFVIMASFAVNATYKIKVMGQAVTIMVILTVTALTGLYSAGTIKRNYVWRDEFTLWTDTVKKSPDSYAPHLGLGKIYYEKGLIDKAVEHFEIALRLRPNFPVIHRDLGTAYLTKGFIDKAIEHYQIAVSLMPNYPDAHNDLGNAYRAKGLLDKAVRRYQTALMLRPNFPEARDNLQEILEKEANERK